MCHHKGGWVRFQQWEFTTGTYPDIIIFITKFTSSSLNYHQYTISHVNPIVWVSGWSQHQFHNILEGKAEVSPTLLSTRWGLISTFGTVILHSAKYADFNNWISIPTFEVTWLIMYMELMRMDGVILRIAFTWFPVSNNNVTWGMLGLQQQN